MLSSELTAEHCNLFQLLKAVLPPGKFSDDKIIDELRSKHWDPNEAYGKLFNTDPSPEVERKKDKEEEVHEDHAPKKKTTSRKRKQPNTPNTPVSDGTPNSVGDGTPPPLNDVPLNAVFKPSDYQIMVLLKSHISGVHVVGNMVRRRTVYNKTPNLLVRNLYQYIDNGIPHYLALSATKLINAKKIRDDYLKGGVKKQRRRRAVRDKEGKILGYWAAHGERWMITDEKEEVVGSKLLFTFDDGHLRNREKGMQRSVWCMEEYRVEHERKTERTEAELKFTICKLYKDSKTSHVDAFKESELHKERATKLRNDIYTLCRRKGLNYKGVKFEKDEAFKVEDVLRDDMVNSITLSRLPPKFEEELIDDCQRSRHEIEVESVRMTKKSKPCKDQNDDKCEKIDISEETLKSWKKYKYMEEDKNKWAGSATDFVTSEKAQAFRSTITWMNLHIDREFMATLLRIKCSGWLSEVHMNTWVRYIMKHIRQSLIREGKEARWTVLPNHFDHFLLPKKSAKVLVNGKMELRWVSDDENDKELEVRKDDPGSYEPDLDWPKLWDVDNVYMPLHSLDHWVLVELRLVDFTVKVYNSEPAHRKLAIRKHIQKWEKRLHSYLNQIGFWEEKKTSAQDLKITVIEDDIAPKQENGYDCGVMTCRVLEKIVKEAPLVEEGKTGMQIGIDYRKYMADTIYSHRY